MRVHGVGEDRPLDALRHAAHDGGLRPVVAGAEGVERAGQAGGGVDGRAAGGAAEVVEQQVGGVAAQGGVEVLRAELDDPAGEDLGVSGTTCSSMA